MRGHCGSSHKVLNSTQARNNELNGNYDKNVSPCIHTYRYRYRVGLKLIDYKNEAKEMNIAMLHKSVNTIV